MLFFNLTFSMLLTLFQSYLTDIPQRCCGGWGL